MALRTLNGKVALITGASSGMGRATALALAEQGTRLVCCDLTAKANPAGFEKDLETSTSNLINQRGGEAVFQQVDISHPLEIEGAFQECITVSKVSGLESLQALDKGVEYL